MLLGGVGEALILKWVGAKLTGMMATHLAHAGTTATMHVAMHSANAAIVGANTAAATGGALGAGTFLYHSAKAHNTLFKNVMAEREKLGLPADFNPTTEEEAAQVLIGIALGMLAAGYYESLQHKNCIGTIKTELTQVKACEESGCDCKDYDHAKGNNCKCGHYNFRHGAVDQTDVMSLVWLWEDIAKQVYPELQNRNGEGQYKKMLSSIDTCMVGACPCNDFDLCEANQVFSRRCTCGHRWREHTVTGSWGWIVMVLAQLLLATMAEAAE